MTKLSVHDQILKDFKEINTSSTTPDIVAALDSEDLKRYLKMSKEEMIEVLATHEDHHNQHHEQLEELNEWKETVRNIFDLIAIKDSISTDDVESIIAERHYEYFYQGPSGRI